MNHLLIHPIVFFIPSEKLRVLVSHHFQDNHGGGGERTEEKEDKVG